jgi:leader peptidase (prepilin peptidase)/N-methyltransferase
MPVVANVSIALVIGLFVAALLTIFSIRLPRERGFAGWPHCIGCMRPLAVWQMLPIAGWLLQRGRARCCGRRLPAAFLFGELIYVVAFVWLAARYGASFSLVYYACIVAALVVIGVVDWQHRLIYTLPTLAVAAFALAGAQWVRGHSWLNALLGLIAAGAIFVVFYLLARFLFPARSAPFGLGDVYLSLALGAAFGFLHLAPMLFVGMGLAGFFSIFIIIARALGRATPTYISYGSFLCLGAIVYLLGRVGS